jgi:hypothetical protein
MKAMCGPQYTKKLEDMYQDLAVSEEASRVSAGHVSLCPVACPP